MTAEEVKAAGAMAVLLKDAIKPNIVQTLEGQLCFMHAGPFANIAHGNNSIIADRIALKLGEFVITESGFAADLGMEKFMDIVCRVGGFRPHVVVIVATVRALRHHGGGDWREKEDLSTMAAEVEVGMANLAKHIENVRAFGIQPVVAINTRPDDEPELLELIKARSLEAGAFGAAIHDGFGKGGEGTTELAEVVAAASEAESDFRMLYDDDEPIATKIREDRDDRLRRGGDRARRRCARVDRPDREAGPRAPADLHGEDPPLALARPGAPQPARGIRRPDSRHPRLLRRRACSCRSAATCCKCPASAPNPPPSRSTSTRTARRWGCSRSLPWGEASASSQGTAHFEGERAIDYALPMSDLEGQQLTAAQREALEAELADMEGPQRKAAVDAIATARAFGDLSENFEYHAAKNEQGLLEARITRLRHKLQHAVTVEHTSTDTVGVGSIVEIEDEQGEKMEIEISSVGGVSPDSPLGGALMGTKVGEGVDVPAPRGSWRATVVSIRAS